MFVVSGLTYGVSVCRLFGSVMHYTMEQNGIQNPFRINVWVPNMARWARVPLPATGQSAMARGEIIRRKTSGFYTIPLVDMALPLRGSTGDAPSTITPTSKRARRQVKRHPVEAFGDDRDDQPFADPSGTSHHTLTG